MSLRPIPHEVEAFRVPELGYLEEPFAKNGFGRVRCLGTTWPAQLNCSTTNHAAAEGDRVIVVGRVGLTMLVSLSAITPMMAE